MDTLTAMSLADEPAEDEIGDAQYEPAIEGLVDPHRRAQLRARLRRQAWVLDRFGASIERDVALAVSASLLSIGLNDLVSHPFLRAMLDRSVATTITAFGSPDDADLSGELSRLAELAGLPGFPNLADLTDLEGGDDWDDEDWDWDDGLDDDDDEAGQDPAHPG
jgi:hypothetical protein